MDKSWLGDTSATVRVRTNDSLAERSAARAKARDERAAERVAGMGQRMKERAAARSAASAAREQARVDRREAEQAAIARDPQSAAATRRRGSGRKDIVREQRDTSGYVTAVDVGRMRELARRGATVAGLAAAFGITEQEVEQVLAGAAE